MLDILVLTFSILQCTHVVFVDHKLLAKGCIAQTAVNPSVRKTSGIPLCLLLAFGICGVWRSAFDYMIVWDVFQFLPHVPFSGIAGTGV